MMMRYLMAILALMASADIANAQTKVIAGDKGFARQNLSGAAVYDATRATVHVIQGRNNTCFSIRPNSRNNAAFLGGRCIGEGINRTHPWATVHSAGNGASIRFEGSPNFTVRRHYTEFAWDPIKPASGSPNWKVEDSWLKNARDDAIEADHAGTHSGIVRRTFFDGVHTFLSVTPGKQKPILHNALVEFYDNVMSLGCGVVGGKCENRAKRLDKPESNPRGSGQAFKVRGCGAEVGILFRGNAVAMGAELVNGSWVPVGINTEADLTFFQCMRLRLGSTENSFYWIGAIPANCNGGRAQGLRFEVVRGACVPEAFNLNPSVFTFVSNDRAAWLARVAKWKSEVWS